MASPAFSRRQVDCTLDTFANLIFSDYPILFIDCALFVFFYEVGYSSVLLRVSRTKTVVMSDFFVLKVPESHFLTDNMIKVFIHVTSYVNTVSKMQWHHVQLMRFPFNCCIFI